MPIYDQGPHGRSGVARMGVSAGGVHARAAAAQAPRQHARKAQRTCIAHADVQRLIHAHVRLTAHVRCARASWRACVSAGGLLPRAPPAAPRQHPPPAGGREHTAVASHVNFRFIIFIPYVNSTTLTIYGTKTQKNTKKSPFWEWSAFRPYVTLHRYIRGYVTLHVTVTRYM